MYNLTLSIVLGCIGILVLALALVLRPAFKARPSEPAGEDLLATAAEATVARAHSDAEAQTGTSPMPPQAMDITAQRERETEGTTSQQNTPGIIAWTESEEVYRPTSVDADGFIRGLGMERPPEIRSNHAYLFIRRPVYDQVRSHLKANLEVEQGGLLFGQAFLDDERATYLVMVEAALPATGAEELPNALTYTPEAWQKITPEMQKLNPAWTLIGSYHSHPGMGVFLSGVDLDTQADVFAQDWQIALVIDPVADETGFYMGKGGKPCPDWYIL